MKAIQREDFVVDQEYYDVFSEDLSISTKLLFIKRGRKWLYFKYLDGCMSYTVWKDKFIHFETQMKNSPFYQL